MTFQVVTHRRKAVTSSYTSTEDFNRIYISSEDVRSSYIPSIEVIRYQKAVTSSYLPLEDVSFRKLLEDVTSRNTPSEDLTSSYTLSGEVTHSQKDRSSCKPSKDVISRCMKFS